MRDKKFKTLIAACCTVGLLSLSSCGGGNTTTTTVAAPAVTGAGAANIVQLAGVVVDGYMKGARAFVDRNNNGILDKGEPSGITDVNGAYTISPYKAGDENYPIVVDIPANATDSDVPGQTVGKHSIMSAPATGSAKQSIVVSPMTTMVKTVMESTPGATRFTAANTIKANLGLSVGNNVDLFADYVALKNQGADASNYAKVHKLAQVVARTVGNQVDKVYLTAKGVNPNATLSAVVSLITSQVVAQLSSIQTVVSTTPRWTPSVADKVAVNDTVPLDTYGQAFVSALQKQLDLTLAAANTANAAAQAANAKAQVANANANTANTAALNTLKQAQLALAQAQQLQDTYTAALAKANVTLVQQAATKVTTSTTATAAKKAAATQAVKAAKQTATVVKTASATQKSVNAVNVATAKAATQGKAAPALVLNKVKFTIMDNYTNYNINLNQFGQPLPQPRPRPIAGAVVVMDQGGAANTFTTDAYGQVLLPGIDVGLHDLHVFAKGYTWLSIYQMTANNAGNNTLGLNAYIAPQVGAITGNSWSVLNFDVTLPALSFPAPKGKTRVVEVAFTDSYGNTSSGQFQQNWNGIASPTFGTANIQIQAAPGSLVSGSVGIKEVTCDVYAMNCQVTNVATIAKVSTTSSQNWNSQVGVLNTPITVAYATNHLPTAITPPNSQVVLDAYATNTLVNIKPGTTAPNGWVNPNVSVFLSVKDAYGQTTDYQGSLSVPTVSVPATAAVAAVKDQYGNIVTPAVAATPATWKIASGAAQSIVTFWNIPAGTSVTGTLIAVEGWNASETDRVNLGSVTWTTTAMPYPGIAASPQKVLSTMKPINIAFSAVKPTPKTVLMVSNVVPPRGLALQQVLVQDTYSYSNNNGWWWWGSGSLSGYFDVLWNNQGVPAGQQQPLILPHTFQSTRNLATMPLMFQVNASNANNLEGWDMNKPVVAGGNINMAASFMSAPTIMPSPINKSLTITSAFPANTSGIYHSIDIGGNANNGSAAWRIVAPLSLSTINLPLVPAGVGKNVVKGNGYGLFFQEAKMTNQTYQGMILWHLANPSINQSVTWQEERYWVSGIPYTY